MVLRVENGVGPEGLCDVFVKVGGEGQVRVEVVDEAAVVRLPQDEQHVVVPDHQLLLNRRLSVVTATETGNPYPPESLLLVSQP